MVDDSTIGGVGREIEMDESLLSKRKYHRGRLVEQVWMFGGIDRAYPTKFFVEIVSDRSKETLLENIKRKILPGTTIYSDGWASYKCLVDNGYQQSLRELCRPRESSSPHSNNRVKMVGSQETSQAKGNESQGSH